MTKNAQHTAGPWEACERGDYSDDGIVILGDDMRVAVVNRDEDAALIAAAPDLLDIAKRSLTHAMTSAAFRGQRGWDTSSSEDKFVEDARAAIAKAEGRS